MNLLGGNPEDILTVGFAFDDAFLELGVGRLLNGRVVLELSEKVWLIFHDSLWEYKCN